MFTFAEQTNRLRAVRSLASDVCPACSSRKAERTAICFNCIQKLPEGLQLRLTTTRFSTPDYGAMMAEIMQALGVRRFMTPPPHEKCLLFPATAEHVTRGHLRKSLFSHTCPACGGRKNKSKRLCLYCVPMLKEAYLQNSPLARDEAEIEFTQFLNTMRPPECYAEPVAYLANFTRLLELLGAEFLHVPIR